jgi:hypothetical protein
VGKNNTQSESDLLMNFLIKSRQEREEARYNWNKAFPPEIEVQVDEGLDEPTMYGIWQIEDGVMIIPKSKNGYHPEKSIIIYEEIMDAIRSKFT